MSGHSKWNNIKRKKEKTDAQKGKIFTKIGREMAVAVREGGPDPLNNGKLRDLIAKAKANNVPNDNIDRIIKKAAGEGDKNTYVDMVYEGYGPSGVAVIVEALTDNKNRTAGDLRHYFDKCGGNLGQTGCVSFMFIDKGVIVIDNEDDKYTEDQIMEDCMEAGAEDFEFGDVELVIFVVEGTRWTPDDEMVLNKLREGKAPVILAVNKVDNVQEKADLLPHLQFLASQMNFLDIVPISAETGLNVDTIAAIVRKHLPEATHHFPEDYITDRSQRFMASEIIREKLMRFLGAELPYSVTVEIERFVSNERGGYDINGLILVEREGQKKMVIGNKGAKIKTIGIEARKDMQEMFEAPVHLELWVKVKSGWADDERALRSLGYVDDL